MTESFIVKPLTTENTPKWFVMLNLVGIGMGAALLIASLIIGEVVVAEPPFDFAILMRSAEIFCFDHANFQYGVSVYTDGGYQLSFYPAPFYTTFCVPNHYAALLLLVLWQFIPFGIAVWLSGRRAAILSYPPLFLLLLLGQSTGWLLPLYIVAAWTMRGYPIRWWHSIVLVVGVFKPHLAFPAVIYLLYRWRKQPSLWLIASAAMLAITLPAFLIMPNWVVAWLPRGRGFEPENMATVARLPVRLLEIGFAPDGVTQAIVWLFCGVIAAGLFFLLRWRRGSLTFYDFALIFFFCIPPLHDYDLIILLPFIAPYPRRLLLALTAGNITWLYALMTGTALGNLGYYNMSILITMALLAERLWQRQR